MCGATWAYMFRRIVLPLLLPAIMGAWVWIFLQSIKELSTAVLLAGPGTQLVSVFIFDLWEDAQLVDLAAFVSVFSAGLILLAYVAQKLSNRFGTHV